MNFCVPILGGGGAFRFTPVHPFVHPSILCPFSLIALDLVKICNFQLVLHITQKVFDVVMKLYRDVGQHAKLCFLVFACGFILLLPMT
jgi:hypothetical protein